MQGPLVALAPRLAAYTKPGGLLGLSGEPLPACPPACLSASCLVPHASHRPTICRYHASVLSTPFNSLQTLTTLPISPCPSRLLPHPAGILQEQVPAVQAAYAPWFDGFEVAAEDRWALVTAVRRSTDS
jgi:hypothetical protein